MKKLKNILFLCFALTASLAFTVACKPDEGNSSSSEYESSSSSSEEADYPDTFSDDCVLGDWELVRAADCETRGIKVRRCTSHEGETHEDYEFFEERRHSYDTKGICQACGKELPLPTPNANAKYMNLEDPETDVLGTGHEYPVNGIEDSGKYELYLDEYYEAEINETGECWFKFGVPEPGHYAVISTSNPDETSLHQYTDTGYLQGETNYFEDGNFLSVVSCTEQYFSNYWSIAYRITGAPGDVVRFYITKVAPDTWEPDYITVEQPAKELKGQAPEGEEGKAPVEVPYTSSYFYDETCGFYRMGSVDSPGEIIYMAIDADIPRLFGDNSFVGLQDSGAAGLRYKIGTTVEGDHIMGAFAPMIYNDPEHNGRTESYQTYMNSDGMYPVTQELREFLEIYTAKNQPQELPEEGYEEHVWLAACFYYGNLIPGSQAHPVKIDNIGTYTATQYNVYDKFYYQFTPGAELVNTETLECTITVHTEGAYFWIGDERHSAAEGPITFEVSLADGVILSFMYSKMEIVDIQFTLDADVNEEGENAENDK